MTNEELELMTKMNAEGLSDLRHLRREDVSITNKNNQTITQSFKDIAFDIGKLEGRIDTLEVLLAFYTGIKLGDWLYKRFDLGTKIDKIFKKNDPQEKEASNDEFIEDDI